MIERTRFFSPRGPFSLTEIAERTRTQLVSGADGSLMIEDVAPLASAGPRDISFLTSPRHLNAFVASRAGACFVSTELATKAPPGMAILVGTEPRLSYAVIASAFYSEDPPDGDVSEAAHIASSAKIGNGTSVAAGAVIEADAVVGSDCVIGPNAVIGAKVCIGDRCRISNGVSITHSILGNRVIVHANASLGQDGFGYVASPDGLQKIPQIGRLIVHDDVEIGANTTIDRGTGDDTVIGQGTKIDNQVQVGHNCRVGRMCILCGQSGLAGSVVLEDGVVIGGQVAIADHVHIEAGVHVGGKSGVTRHFPAGIKVMGYPAKPVDEWRFEQIALKQLGKELRKKRTRR